MKRESLDEKTVYKKVQNAIKINKQANLFHKSFLKPIQIALKTRITENDKYRDVDSLAYGLKQVIKKDISFNNYSLQDFDSFQNIQESDLNYRYIVQNNYDNMISLMKHKDKRQKMQLVICICMYSEDKTMLRKTLSGVANNIATFVRNGISSDQIAVCVVMDGIQKVDKSVVGFFEEMEKQSNIYLDDQIDPLNIDEIESTMVDDNDEQQVWNLNNFIFDQMELLDQKKRRFSERKREYEEVKAMIKRIQELQKDKNVTFYDLDQFLKPFFIDHARSHYKRFKKLDEVAINKISNEQIIIEYADNIKACKPIILNCLNQAKNYCNKYISTRDNLSLLNSFRVDIQYGSFTQGMRKQDYEKLNEEQIQNQQSVVMNLFLITKYKNMGKLSSHNWFFNGFCQQVPCKYAVLLDVGLTPAKNALFKMYKYMDNDPKCGGVCGYMKLRMQSLDAEENKLNDEADCITRLALKIVDIQRAQQVQYHFGHLIDKSFQSFFNFIHVLPGAFSAYKMQALKLNSQTSESSTLMKEYFKSLDDSASDVRRKAVKITPCQAFLRVILPDMMYRCCNQIDENTDEQLLYDSNVYLAEDRTLCMGIHQNGYKLQYLPDASGWVDPIKTLPAFLGQRKRWINGSFFAFEKVRRSMTIHGCGQFMLQLQILYLAFMNMLAFVAPAMFLFTIHIAMFAFRDWAFRALENQTGDSVSFDTFQFYNAFVYVIDFSYILMMFGLILFSMHFTHRNPRFLPYIYGFSTAFGILALIVFIVLLYDMISGLIDGQTFLVSNPTLRDMFFANLPGGQTTFLIYKYLVVAVLGSYLIPMIVYALFFHRLSFIFEIICGSLSFLFYTPTYLNILNTFALCRIDDISWGTKGLDSTTGGRTKQLIDTWKTVKIIYIAKYIFWNIVVGVALLVISSPIFLSYTEDPLPEVANSYVRKFFVTLALMAIIFITLMIKIILGIFYSIKYRCCKKSFKIHKTDKKANFDSRITGFFESIKDSIYMNVQTNINELVSNVKSNDKTVLFNNMNSILLKAKSINKGKPNRKTIEKWNASYKMKSKVIKKKSKDQNQHNAIEEISNEPTKKHHDPIESNGSAKNFNEGGQDFQQPIKNKKKRKFGFLD